MKRTTEIAAERLGLGLLALSQLAGAGWAVGAETKVCRGILMSNWTDDVADYSPRTDDRLIMPINSSHSTVNSACLFDAKSQAGKKIMSVCQMGFPCKAKVKLSDEPADVYIIGRVLSVVNISKPK